MIAAYIIKMILCSLLLYLVYVTGLENEGIHRFKRFYLLISVIFSLIIPLCVIHIPVDSIGINPQIVYYPIQNPVTEQMETEEFIYTPGYDNTVKIDKNFYLVILYLLVTGTFLYRLVRNLIKIIRTDIKEFTYYKGVKVVLLNKATVPYSFGNRIYVNIQDYKNRIPVEIMVHESGHVRQKHTLDIIFIELVLSFFWFNPFFYLYRKKIRLNHEFLADRAVLNLNPDVAGYQQLLLSEIVKNKRSIGLTSQLNFLTTKKRFIMMTKTTSRKKAIWKKVIVLPVMALSVILFSGKSLASDHTDIIIEEVPVQIIIPGKGVDETKLKEYENMVRKYAKITDGEITGWETKSIPDSDIDKFYPIYVQMSKEQRQKQYLHMVGFFTSFRRSYPNRDEWNACKKRPLIWLNGVEMDGAELEKYKRQDFAIFFNLSNKETGLYHSALWTKEGYDEYLKKYEEGIPLEELLAIRPQIWHKRFKNQSGL